MHNCLSTEYFLNCALLNYYRQELSDRFRNLELVARQRKQECEWLLCLNTLRSCMTLFPPCKLVTCVERNVYQTSWYWRRDVKGSSACFFWSPVVDEERMRPIVVIAFSWLVSVFFLFPSVSCCGLSPIRPAQYCVTDSQILSITNNMPTANGGRKPRKNLTIQILVENIH